MELTADERPVPYLGDDALRPGYGGRRPRRERVREIEGVASVNLRPADPRHAARAQALGAAGNQPEPGHTTVLLRRLERELEAEADAENRPVGSEPLAERLVVAALPQAGHRGPCGTDAGQHGEIRVENVGRLLDAEPRECEPNAADIARAVLAHRDVHSTPFVDGMSADSIRTASPSARPSALNDASATWCASRPSAVTWIVARAACAKLDRTCAASPGSSASDSSACARPPRSTATRATASSMGTTAFP